MSGTSRNVGSALKPPPDQVPFFKLKDILKSVPHQLDQLNLLLASIEDEDVSQPLRDIRAVAAEQTATIVHAVGFADDFSGQILALLDAVVTRPTDSTTTENINNSSRWAGNTAKLFEDGDNGLTRLTKEMPRAAAQIASSLKNEKLGVKSSTRISNVESEKLLADLLTAVRVSSSILRQIGKYYRDMQTRLAKLGTLIATTQPSEGELEMVRQRWDRFSAVLTELPSEIGKIEKALGALPKLSTGRSNRPSGN